MSPAESERLIETLAYSLYLATLVGDPAPRIKELHQTLTHPQPGDLVLEISSIYDARPERAGTRLGRLESFGYEPMWTPEEWAEMGEESSAAIPREKVYYITLADGREYRWHNAAFIVVPQGIID